VLSPSPAGSSATFHINKYIQLMAFYSAELWSNETKKIQRFCGLSLYKLLAYDVQTSISNENRCFHWQSLWSNRQLWPTDQTSVEALLPCAKIYISLPPCKLLLQQLYAIDTSINFGGHFFLRSCSSNRFRRSFKLWTTFGFSLFWKIFPCNDVDLPNRKPNLISS
jgi:hypothetical protein